MTRETSLHWRPVLPGAFVTSREGETRIGQVLRAPQTWDDLLASIETESIVILGIPESIGPRANFGRAGAEAGFAAFLSEFLNMQASGRIPLENVCIGGEIDCRDLMALAANLDAKQPTECHELRVLCAELDVRAEQVLQPIFQRGARVLLIGGGHNNAYPLLTSLACASGDAVGAINLDPHADFRPREGRHSGNGFHYAYAAGALAHYLVVSLHEAKNSRATLDHLQDAGASYISIHQLQESHLHAVMDEVLVQVQAWDRAFGIELDIDAITAAPASAYNNAGVSLAEAQTFVRRLASLPPARYLHLAEAAPCCHPAGLTAGQKAVGQILSELVLTYILATNK